MLDAISRSEMTQSINSLPTYIRARGLIHASFQSGRSGTAISDLREAGGYRLKFPHAPLCEAMIVNTGGGMVSGDRLHVNLDLEEGAQVLCSTQSAEKIYRSDGAVSIIENHLHLAQNAYLNWLPQETILFEGARLNRQLTVDMKSSAHFLACEILVFGRHAMGEALRDVEFADHWDIRRDGRLIFAERVHMRGNLQYQLNRKAVGNGARAITTLLHVAPDAEGQLEDLRDWIADRHDEGVEWGASAWDGLLCLRAASSNPFDLRRLMTQILAYLTQNQLPRVWHC